MTEKKQTFFQRMAELADAYGDSDVKLTTSQRITGAIAKSVERGTLGRLGRIGEAISASFRDDNFGKGDKKGEKRAGEKSESESGGGRGETGESRAGSGIIGDDIVVAIERSRNSIVNELMNLDGTFRTGLQSINSAIKSQSAFLNSIEDYSEDSYLILENIYELLSMIRNEGKEPVAESETSAFPEKPKPKEEEAKSGFIDSLLSGLGYGLAGAAGGAAAGAAARGRGGPKPTGGSPTGTAGKAGASTISRVGGAVGRAVPVVGGAVTGGMEYAESGDIFKSIMVGAGSTLGAIAGGVGGSFVTPVAGTVAGGVAGGYAGGELAGGLYDTLFSPSEKPKDVSRETKTLEQVQEKMDFTSNILNFEAKEIIFKANKISMPGLPVRTGASYAPSRVEKQEEMSMLDQITSMLGFGAGEEKTTPIKPESSMVSSMMGSPTLGSLAEIKNSSYSAAKAGGSYVSFKQPPTIAASQKTSSGQMAKNVTVSRGVDTRIEKSLSDKVSSLQGTFGKKLTVISGFRDQQRNKSVGGASNSAHTRGNAVDVRFDGGVEETVKLINLASKAGIGGIGVYRPGLLHLDTEGKRAWGPSYRYDSVPDWAKEAIDAHLGKRGTSPQETMMASAESPSPSMGQNLYSSSGEKPVSSASMVSSDASNMISSLSSETALNSAAPVSTMRGGNVINNVSNVSDTNQATERFSSKVPLPAIDVMFQKLFDSSGMF